MIVCTELQRILQHAAQLQKDLTIHVEWSKMTFQLAKCYIVTRKDAIDTRLPHDGPPTRDTYNYPYLGVDILGLTHRQNNIKG